MHEFMSRGCSERLSVRTEDEDAKGTERGDACS
jgi:hypothetical protein